jgi:hypothetical protein
LGVAIRTPKSQRCAPSRRPEGDFLL